MRSFEQLFTINNARIFYKSVNGGLHPGHDWQQTRVTVKLTEEMFRSEDPYAAIENAIIEELLKGEPFPSDLPEDVTRQMNREVIINPAIDSQGIITKAKLHCGVEVDFSKGVDDDAGLA